MQQPIDSRYVPCYAGLASFFRLPYTPERTNFDIAVFGIPWDGGVTDRPGACLGPRHVRLASSYASRPEHGVLGVRPFDLCMIGDAGDVDVNPVQRDVTMEAIRRKVRGLVEGGALPLAVGGDHLCTLGVLQGLKPKRPIALIQFDAHVDTWDCDFAAERHTHGTPFRRAVEGQLIDPRRMVQIGIRELIHSKADMEFGRQAGITCITTSTLRREGIDAVINRTRDVVGDLDVYLTVDIDVLDPAYAPGTGTPEVGGLGTIELMELIRGLSSLRVIGADVMEVAPAYDHSGITGLAAATILYELMCAMVVRLSDKVSKKV